MIINNVRKVINNNKLYAFMVVFILLMQAIMAFGLNHDGSLHDDSIITSEEFRAETKAREEALKVLLTNNPKLAQGFGIFFLVFMGIIVTGAVLLTEYIKKKRLRYESLPKTLEFKEPFWSVIDVVKICIIFVFFYYLFSFIAGFLNSILSSGSMDRRSGLLASTGFMDILILMFILRFVLDKYKQGIETLGLSLKNIGKNIGIALYGYVAFLPILCVLFVSVVIVAKLINYMPQPEPVYELIFKEARPKVLILVAFLISLLGPIIEEIFFRGFLYSALRKSIGAFWAILLSAFLFSILHTNILGFLPIMALGLFLAYLREKTNSLMPSIVVHVFHNSVLVIMMFIVRYLTSSI